MFSDHLNKIDNVSTGKLWAIAGGAVILCQLVAFAMVADGQVKKAEVRESRLAFERVAVANCMESSVGAARHACLQQARSSNTYLTAEAKGGVPLTSGSQMARNETGLGAAPNAPALSGMMPVSFASN